MRYTLSEVKEEELNIADDLKDIGDKRFVVNVNEKVKEDGKIISWDQPDDSSRINSKEPDDFSRFEPTWCDICEHWNGILGKCTYSESDDEQAVYCDSFEYGHG